MARRANDFVTDPHIVYWSDVDEIDEGCRHLFPDDVLTHAETTDFARQVQHDAEADGAHSFVAYAAFTMDVDPNSNDADSLHYILFGRAPLVVNTAGSRRVYMTFDALGKEYLLDNGQLQISGKQRTNVRLLSVQIFAKTDTAIASWSLPRNLQERPSTLDSIFGEDQPDSPWRQRERQPQPDPQRRDDVVAGVADDVSVVLLRLSAQISDLRDENRDLSSRLQTLESRLRDVDAAQLLLDQCRTTVGDLEMAHDQTRAQLMALSQRVPTGDPSPPRQLGALAAAAQRVAQHRSMNSVDHDYDASVFDTGDPGTWDFADHQRWLSLMDALYADFFRKPVGPNASKSKTLKDDALQFLDQMRAQKTRDFALGYAVTAKARASFIQMFRKAYLCRAGYYDATLIVPKALAMLPPIVEEAISDALITTILTSPDVHERSGQASKRPPAKGTGKGSPTAAPLPSPPAQAPRFKQGGASAAGAT
jgi:hypothetical protein